MSFPSAASDSLPPRDGSMDHAVIAVVADLAAAGMPLPAGLRAAAQESDSARTSTGLRALAAQLEQGQTFDECVANAKNLPPYVVGLIRAAQSTPDVGLTIAAWTENRRSAQQYWRAAMAAFAYPALSLALALVVLLFIHIAVVPVFRTMFNEFGLKLPAATAFLFKTTEFVQKFFLPSVIVVSTVALATRVLGGGQYWSWLIGIIPLVGRVWHWTAVTEMLRNLSLLLQYKVPLPTALRLTADGTSDSYVAEQCRRLAARVEGGTSLTMSLVYFRTLPLSIVPLVRWGEQHAALDDALRSAAEMIESRLNVRTSILAQVVPPLVFVLVGICVASTFVALFVPLISLIQGLS